MGFYYKDEERIFINIYEEKFINETIDISLDTIGFLITIRSAEEHGVGHGVSIKFNTAGDKSSSKGTPIYLYRDDLNNKNRSYEKIKDKKIRKFIEEIIINCKEEITNLWYCDSEEEYLEISNIIINKIQIIHGELMKSNKYKNISYNITQLKGKWYG